MLADIRSIFRSPFELGICPPARAEVTAGQSMAAIPVSWSAWMKWRKSSRSSQVACDEHADGGFGGVDAAGAGAERLRQGVAGHGVPAQVSGLGTAVMTEAAVSR